MNGNRLTDLTKGYRVCIGRLHSLWLKRIVHLFPYLGETDGGKEVKGFTEPKGTLPLSRDHYYRCWTCQNSSAACYLLLSLSSRTWSLFTMWGVVRRKGYVALINYGRRYRPVRDTRTVSPSCSLVHPAVPCAIGEGRWMTTRSSAIRSYFICSQVRHGF